MREVRTFEAMTRHLRTKAPPRRKDGTSSPSEEMYRDRGLCNALDLVVEKGRGLAQELDESPVVATNLLRDLAFFMDLAFVAKADFFNQLQERDLWLPD
jgi:hypothetical protein